MAHFLDESLESQIGENSRSQSSSERFEELDSILSGESKFKNYSFEPCSGRSPKEIQQCIDFWKFIEDRSDLFPKRGFKMQQDCRQITKKKSSNQEDLTWAGVLDLLKSKNLHKVANLGGETKEICKIEPCFEISEKKDKGKLKLSGVDDDFSLDNLDEYDPQKVTFAENETQTDPIEIADKEMQTDVTASDTMLNNNMQRLDELLKEVADADLTGYFDCICDEPCAWLPYPSSKASIGSHRQPKPGKQNKCTCSCGEWNCLCSLCADILKAIEKAKDSFEQLSEFEIEQCPCARTSCACLDDYRTLLDVKLEINQVVREVAKDPYAKLSLPLRCKCSCQQANCPCKIVMQLFTELDELMGYKEKPLFYHEKEMDMTFGVDVCRCDGEYDKEHCACLSFYKQHLQAKIDLSQSSSAASSTSSLGLYNLSGVCTGECREECTLEICTAKITRKDEKCAKSNSSEQTCDCENLDCCTTVTDSSSILIDVHDYSESTFPPTLVPANSAYEIENTFK